MYGYYDYKGKKVLDTKYESISRVLDYNDEDVYLIAMSNGKKGVLKNGKKIIDLNYQDVIYSRLSEIFYFLGTESALDFRFDIERSVGITPS